MAFDLLYRDGRDLTARPLRDWRARLEDMLTCNDLVCSRCAGSRRTAWRRGRRCSRGYEGLVAKDDRSQYAGGPTRRWLNVKQQGWTDAQAR
jgi:ATP-dependent DNA ligase